MVDSKMRKYGTVLKCQHLDTAKSHCLLCMSVFESQCDGRYCVCVCVLVGAGSAEKEAERAQTKVGLCAPSTVDLWKIPRQRCAKMPGPARRDSGGM